jgi:hypothetical protein
VLMLPSSGTIKEIRRYRSLVTDKRRRQPLPFRQPLLTKFW